MGEKVLGFNSLGNSKQLFPIFWLNWKYQTNNLIFLNLYLVTILITFILTDQVKNRKSEYLNIGLIWFSQGEYLSDLWMVQFLNNHLNWTDFLDILDVLFAILDSI